jgi:ferredoxin
VEAVSPMLLFTTFDDIGYVPRYENRAHDRFVTLPAVRRYECRYESISVTLPSAPQVGSMNWFRQQTGHATGCVMCGAPLAKRWRMTCGSACRQRAYRLRKRVKGE